MPKCFCGNEMTRKDWKHQWVCHKCGRTKPLYESMTNADRIRSMTDEELAEFLCRYDACSICSHNNCKLLNCDEIGITERWLKSEVGCE